MNYTFQVFSFLPQFCDIKNLQFLKKYTKFFLKIKNLPIFLGQKLTKFVGKETLIAIV